MQNQKNMSIIEALEKRIKRELLAGKIEDMIVDLNYLISELHILQRHEKADLLELALNQYILGRLTDPETRNRLDAVLHLPPSPDFNFEVIEVPE